MRPTFDREEAGPIRAWWHETYGGPADLLSGYRFFRGGRHTVWLAWREVDLTTLEAVEGVGMPFVRTDSRHWKPTSVAAVQLGMEVERNVVEVDGREMRALLDRSPVDFPRGDERRDLPWRGYVIARYRGVPVAVGEWHGDRLVSCVPKGKRIGDLDWSLDG